jgi:diguanylate cyclase (GGDEF)-like protein
MIDIDHFKKVNDSYGHSAGDEIIRAIAEIIRNHCRSFDVACRFGGEEFILMLIDVGKEEAIGISDRMRRVVELRQFDIRKKKKKIKLTISAGITQCQPNDNVDVIVKRVDKALYAAKNGGRNIVYWE